MALGGGEEEMKWSYWWCIGRGGADRLFLGDGCGDLRVGDFSHITKISFWLNKWEKFISFVGMYIPIIVLLLKNGHFLLHKSPPRWVFVCQSKKWKNTEFETNRNNSSLITQFLIFTPFFTTWNKWTFNVVCWTKINNKITKLRGHCLGGK